MDLTDKDYLKGIEDGDEGIIKQLYDKYFGSILQLVSRNSGNREDAEDVFQDAIMVIYNKIKEKKLNLTSSLHTFLYAIARNLWLKQLNKRKSQVAIDDQQDMPEDSENIQDAMEQQERFKLFKQKMAALGEDCQKLLKLFFEGTTMKSIADIMGYSSEQYAKKRKFQCKEQLINLIKSDQLYPGLRS